MISQEESRKEDTPRRQDKKLNQNHTNKNPEQQIFSYRGLQKVSIETMKN